MQNRKLQQAMRRQPQRWQPAMAMLRFYFSIVRHTRVLVCNCPRRDCCLYSSVLTTLAGLPQNLLALAVSRLDVLKRRESIAQNDRNGASRKQRAKGRHVKSQCQYQI